jgi:hypothetical protein
MKSFILSLFVAALAVGSSRADFQYSQSSKITGGALVGMTKALGVFSKNARQMTDPQITTTMLKGNSLRTEHSDGRVEIIDLDAKRFVYIDTAKKTYSTMTFDEFKAAMQRAQDRMKEEQAKEVSKHPESANVKVTPKIDVQETGAARTILNLPTKEVKMKIDMQIESTDPKAQEKAQSASITMTTDSWIAESIPGYGEVRDFYVRMAKELDWLPSAMGGMMAGANMNPQMGPAMEEFKKNAVKLKGMPLLQVMSFGPEGGATPPPQSGDAQAQPASPDKPQDKSQDSAPTSAREAIGKSLGGMFGHKKKQEQKDSDASSAGSAQPASPSGSLMDMQTEVTSYSSGSLDRGLFTIPEGYAQVQRDSDDLMGGRKR